MSALMGRKKLRPVGGAWESVGERRRAAAAGLVLRLVMGVLMTRGGLIWGIRPFGIALVAALPVGPASVSVVIGSVLGAVSLWEPAGSAVYAAAAVLTGALTASLRKTRFAHDPAAPSCAAVTTALLVAVLRCVTLGADARTLAAGLTETVLAGASADLFRLAMKSGQDSGSSLQAVGKVTLFAAALTALEPLKIFGIASVGRLAAIGLVQAVAVAGGPGPGAVCGAICGLAMDMAGGTMCLYGAACAMAGALSGCMYSRGRLMVLLSYCLANAAAVIWHALNGVPDVLYEAFSASVAVMLLPEGFFSVLREQMPSGTAESGLLRARRHMRDKVRLTQRAFQRLSESVEKMCGADCNDENVTGVFERAALGVCRRCPGAKQCWQALYSQTLGFLSDAAHPMLERGELKTDDLPEGFLSRCSHPAEYVGSVNAELKAWLCRRQYRARFNENLAAVSSRYRDVSKVFSAVAERLGEDPSPLARVERRLRSYLRSEQLNVSGVVFRDGRGRLHAELAGSGLAALQREPRWLDKLSAVLEEPMRTGDRPEDGRLVLLQAEELSAVVGSASARRRGRGESGDGRTAFTTDDGRLYVLLSDGMGTGKEAGEMSEACIRALEDFLRAGVEPETALGLLESLMILKNENDVVSATVDLLMVDLSCGDAALYKCGSAPTYLRRREGVRCLGAGGYAPGLAPVGESQVCVTRLKLQTGDMLVIVSDGVLAGESDQWLKTLLEESSEGPRELARRLAEASTARYGASDDVTVLTVSIR